MKSGSLSPALETELINYYNVQYYGKLYVGSLKSEMELIFDTGSSWLWLPSKDCGADCHPKAHFFDESLSDTYSKS